MGFCPTMKHYADAAQLLKPARRPSVAIGKDRRDRTSAGSAKLIRRFHQGGGGAIKFSGSNPSLEDPKPSGSVSRHARAGQYPIAPRHCRG